MTAGQQQALSVFWLGLLGASAVGVASFHVVDVSESLSLSPLSEGLAVSIITAIGAAFGMSIAAAIACFAIDRVLLAGALILAMSSAITAVSPDGTVFLVSRAVAGLGFNLLSTAVPIALAQIREDQPRQIALTMWGSYLPIGIAMGIGIAAACGSSWRLTFGIHAGLAAISAVLAIRSPSAEPMPAEGRGGSFDVLVDPVSVCFAAGFACFAAVFLTVVSLLPGVLRNAAGLSIGSAGEISSLACLTSTPVSLWLAVRPPHLSRFYLLTSIGFAGSAVAELLFFFGHRSVILASLAALLIIAVSALIPSVAFSAFPIVAGEGRRAGLSGMMTQFGSFGSLLGPPLITLCTSRYGWPAGCIPLCAICAAGLMLFWSPAQRISRTPAGPPSREHFNI